MISSALDGMWPNLVLGPKVASGALCGVQVGVAFPGPGTCASAPFSW